MTIESLTDITKKLEGSILAYDMFYTIFFKEFHHTRDDNRLRCTVRAYVTFDLSYSDSLTYGMSGQLGRWFKQYNSEDEDKECGIS